MSPLEERIHRLERQNRRLAAAVAVLILVAAAGATVAMAGAGDIPAVLRAERLEILNGSGKAVLIAGSDQWNRGSLIVRDKSGGDCINLGVGICEEEEESGFLQIHGPIGRLVFNDPGAAAGPESILELGACPLHFTDRKDELEGFFALKNTGSRTCTAVHSNKMEVCDEVGRPFFEVYLDDRGRGCMTAPRK
jgi:hypothetical protein